MEHTIKITPYTGVKVCTCGKLAEECYIALQGEIAGLKNTLSMERRHGRAMLGCLKLIAALPVDGFGCFYELRTAHRLAVKGAWATVFGQNDHIFLPAAEAKWDEKLHSAKAHQALALIRRVDRTYQNPEHKTGRDSQPTRQSRHNP